MGSVLRGVFVSWCGAARRGFMFVFVSWRSVSVSGRITAAGTEPSHILISIINNWEIMRNKGLVSDWSGFYFRAKEGKKRCVHFYLCLEWICNIYLCWCFIIILWIYIFIQSGWWSLFLLRTVCLCFWLQEVFFSQGGARLGLMGFFWPCVLPAGDPK